MFRFLLRLLMFVVLLWFAFCVLIAMFLGLELSMPTEGVVDMLFIGGSLARVSN